MRSREFLKPLTEEATNSIQSDLDTISQVTINHPEVSKKINPALSALVNFLKAKAGQNRSIKEDPQTDSLIGELEAMLPGITEPALRDQIEQKIKQIKDSALSAEKAAEQQGFVQGAASVFNVRTASEEIEKLLNQVTQVPLNLRKLVKKELVNYVTEDNQTFDIVKQFISQCATPERYFNLPELIEAEASSSFTTDPNIVPIAKLLAGVVPVGKRSATGKGEVLMMLMGSGASEPEVGDLHVDLGGEVVMVEVKASEGTTDWTLSSSAMNVAAARTILVNTVNKFAGRTVFLDAPAKTEKDGITGISGIGRDTLPILNPIFQQMGAAATKEMFGKMVLSVMGKEVELLLPPLLDSITDRGMDTAKMIPALKQFQFDWYKSKNKHYALITINTVTLSFSIAKTSEKFVGDPAVSATKIFDFRANPGAIITFKQK